MSVAKLYDMLAPSSSIMLTFFSPVESLSERSFISMLLEMSTATLPVLPLPGTPKSPFEYGEYSTSDTLPSASVRW